MALGGLLAVSDRRYRLRPRRTAQADEAVVVPPAPTPVTPRPAVAGSTRDAAA
jgi:hypothetical protein